MYNFLKTLNSSFAKKRIVVEKVGPVLKISILEDIGVRKNGNIILTPEKEILHLNLLNSKKKILLKIS